MVKEFVHDIASLFGVELHEVILSGITTLDQIEAYDLHISSNGLVARTLIHQCELDDLEAGIYGDLLTLEICNAIEQFQNQSVLH